jgi:hypothetical protein
MIDKCSCGARPCQCNQPTYYSRTCDQVETLLAEIDRLKTENWHLKHQIYLLVKEQGE